MSRFDKPGEDGESGLRKSFGFRLPSMLDSLLEGRGSTASEVQGVFSKCGIVTATRLNFREKPTVSSNQPLGKLKQGAEVVIVQEMGFWLKIKDPRGGDGFVFVSGEYVNKKNEPLERTGGDLSPVMSSSDERKLAAYRLPYALHRDQNVRNRTWDHRLIDH